MTLAEKIQKLRKEKGLSQDQLALELGISRQSISKWELGDSMPDIPKILQLADYFQVSTDYLLREEVDTPITSHDPQRSTDTPKPNRTFLKAAKISLAVTILSIVLPIAGSFINGFIHPHRLGTSELFLVGSIVFLKVAPVAGILTILFWVLYHFKK